MFGLILLILLFIVVCVLSHWIYKTYFYFSSITFEQLRDRCVVITGASRGIGEELAYAYSRFGCRLVLAARSIDVLENRVAKECLRQGATDVRCVKFDASKEEACSELIEKTVEFYQRIDILILNHTMASYGQFLDNNSTENIEQMKKHFDTNFFAYFYLAMKALPYLTKSGTKLLPSQIIALSSLAGACPFPKTTIYGTTKHAIQGFFTNLARDLHSSTAYRNHVTSTLVTLGLIATDEALSKTSKHIHWASVSVRKTAESILAAGVYGQAHLFYPYSLIILPALYYVFNPLFKLIARLGN